MSGNASSVHLSEAVALAQRSDVAIVVLGLCGDNYNGGPPKEDPTCFAIDEAEGTDRTSLALPGAQLPLLKRVVATGTPVVLVVINAGPVDLSWAKKNVLSILSAGYGGQYTGQAVADALFGTYNPGGALSFSWFAERFAKLAPYMSMEMRPNATSGSPGRTHRFFDAEKCGPECLSWPFVSVQKRSAWAADCCRDFDSTVSANRAMV